jgi:nitrite reductase (NO-forming)
MSNGSDGNALGDVNRRGFIRVLGGGAAALGLAACVDDAPGGVPGANATSAPSSRSTTAGSASTESGLAVTDIGLATNVDARAVSIVPTLTRLADLEVADSGEVHMTYAPDVPPPLKRSDQRIVEFSIDVIESVCPVDPVSGVDVSTWGFRIGGDSTVTCGAPGPVLRARVGDLAKITVTNSSDASNPHNIDFHAVTGQGGGAAGLTVAPGESATVNSRLLYPGAFMYHCAFGDVPMHIAHGMYGMFIVDPEEALPQVDHEWSIVQSEWYVGKPDADGFAEFDPEALLAEHPRYVTFNGRTDALTGDRSLQMAVGERARFYVVNAGLNLDSNFHPIGSQWDVVYPEAATHPINRVIRGSQSTLVVAGGGTVTELVGYVPSTIILVDHALVRTFYKGCIGMVVVSGDENATFSIGEEGLAAAAANEPEPAPRAAPNTVIIPQGAWNPANAEIAFSPKIITVTAGTTVTWQNNDVVVHTATSGASSGQAGTPNGTFDSGDVQPGRTFEHTFTDAGTFDYFCKPHPWMIGQVVVTK